MNAPPATAGPVAVSIIIPCFNLASVVSETVRSALAQDHPRFEVIVVDDGSTDGSAAELAGLSDPRLKVLHQPNRGAAAARNTGLGASSGRAVLFLDGDDLVPTGHLTALDSRLAGSDTDVAFGQWDRFRSDPSEAAFPQRPTYHDAMPLDWLIEDWANARPMTQCGTFLIPRALIERAGGWDETLSLIDDFEFFARVISASSGMRFAPDARVYYRSGVHGTLSGAKSRKAVESAFRSLMLGTGHLLARRDTPKARRVCANLLADFDYSYYPAHADLRTRARARADDLGGPTIPPDGPPAFHRLRRLIGWRAARRIQLLAERLRAFTQTGQTPAGSA